MKQLGIIISIFLGFSAFAANDWQRDMLNFRSNILELAPFIYSDKEFKLPKNKQKILKHLNSMEKTGHSLRPDISQRLSKEDPSVSYIVNHLEEDIRTAKETFLEKNFSYSQNVLKSAINRCFQCHAQSFQNSSVQSSISPKSIKLLSPLEQADLLIALRNFKKAEELLEKEIDAVKFSPEKMFEIENLVHKYLVVSLRTQKKQSEISKSLSKLKSKKALPKYIGKKIDTYLSSLKSWKPVRGETELEKARKLVKRANQKKDYTYDASGLVESLRASKLLHSFIQKQNSSQKDLAESYLLLGQAYQSMNEPSYWDLHESYFARCISALPKSYLAKSCFKYYKNSVEFRHSGSSGSHIPLRLKLRMAKLKEKSGL